MADSRVYQVQEGEVYLITSHPVATVQSLAVA